MASAWAGPGREDQFVGQSLKLGEECAEVEVELFHPDSDNMDHWWEKGGIQYFPSVVKYQTVSGVWVRGGRVWVQEAAERGARPEFKQVWHNSNFKKSIICNIFILL